MARRGRSGGGRGGRVGGARSFGRRSSFSGNRRSGSLGRSRSSIGRSGSFGRSSGSRRRSYGGGSFGSDFVGYNGNLFSGTGSFDIYDFDYGSYDSDYDSGSDYGELLSFEDSLNFSTSVVDYYIGDGERENSDESMAYLDEYSDGNNINNPTRNLTTAQKIIIGFIVLFILMAIII